MRRARSIKQQQLNLIHGYVRAAKKITPQLPKITGSWIHRFYRTPLNEFREFVKENSHESNPQDLNAPGYDGDQDWLSRVICQCAPPKHEQQNIEVRPKNYHISTFCDNEDNIEQEICGLKSNNNINGKLLASGLNDNKLCIWRLQERTEQHAPYYQFTDSLSAVKAMSWCLWNNNVLATGDGSSDRKIRIYDINNNTGNLLSQCDTQSQVCSIQWNPFEKELLSSHGFTKNQLSIWKYPLLNKTHDLCGHTSRVLHTALSPDGTRVCSAAADETLRFWKVFEDNNNQNNTNDYDSYYSSSTHSNNKNNNNKSGINGLNLRIR